MRGRDSAGNWYEPFLPLFPFAEEYVEGNAWHWLWFVPHDVPGFMALFGGAGPFVERLGNFFQRASEMGDTILPDIYYWHGNEPDIHAAYLFNEAGRPDLAAKWARWIMRTKYKDSPDGLDGNDDGGTLSSWYVFSAMGFFPLNPCDGRYMLGSPLFDRVVLHLAGGDFVVEAEDNSEENLYVQSAFLNGTALEKPWFHHADVAHGGRLQLVMGPAPSEWGQTH
jgi:predicted alpha-1,2-mannosidase